MGCVCVRERKRLGVFVCECMRVCERERVWECNVCVVNL